MLPRLIYFQVLIFSCSAKAKYSINNPIRRRGIVVTARKRQRQMDPSYVMAEATRHSKRRMQSPNMEYFEDSLHSSMSLSPKPRPPFAGKVPVYQRWSRLYQQQVAIDEIPQVPRMKDAELNEFNDIYSMEGKAYTATGFSPSPENLLSPLDVSFRTDAIRFANDTPPPEFSLNNNEFEDINIENDYPRGDLHQEKRFFQGEARRNRGISRFEKQNTGNRISKLRLWNEGIEVGKALI